MPERYEAVLEPETEEPPKQEIPAQVEQQETKSEFLKAAAEIRDDGLREHAENNDKNKTFHTSEHPRTLLGRSQRMAEILNLTAEQEALAEAAIGYHDVVIVENFPQNNAVDARLTRDRGALEGDNLQAESKGAQGNEAKSRELLLESMRKANAKKQTFSEQQMDIAGWSIDATYPDVDFGKDFQGATFKDYPYYDIARQQNPELAQTLDELQKAGIEKGALFFQPHLETPLEEGKTIPKEVLVVALADLGGVGVEKMNGFAKEGDLEMQELYFNLRKPEVLQRLAKGETETDTQDRKTAVKIFENWLDSQVGFATFQALRFEKIMNLLKKQNGISELEEKGIREYFGNYIDNIKGAQRRAADLKQEYSNIESSLGERIAFEQLARQMHYHIE